MMLAEYFDQLDAEVESVIEAEAKLRALARTAPTAGSREETLAEADVLSASKRRLRSVVERGRGADEGPTVYRLTDDPVEIGALAIDPVAREVRVSGDVVQLPEKQYALLRVLASEPARVFTKQQLLRDVWGYGSTLQTRTLDQHASKLRRRLGERFIVNTRGVGYRLVAELPEVVGR